MILSFVKYLNQTCIFCLFFHSAENPVKQLQQIDIKHNGVAVDTSLFEIRSLYPQDASNTRDVLQHRYYVMILFLIVLFKLTDYTFHGTVTLSFHGRHSFTSKGYLQSF